MFTDILFISVQGFCGHTLSGFGLYGVWYKLGRNSIENSGFLNFERWSNSLSLFSIVVYIF